MVCGVYQIKNGRNSKRYKQENTSLAELAEDYPVSKYGIYDIVNGRSWTHVEGPIKGEDY